MISKEIAGKTIEFDSDGHMVNLSEWDENVAKVLSLEAGIYRPSLGCNKFHEKSLYGGK